MISRLAVQDRSFTWRAALLVGTMGLATLLRYAAAFATTGLPFIFYFPAVVLITLFAGTGFGVTAVAVGALLGWLLFLGEPFQMPWTLSNVTAIVLFAASGLFLVWTAALLRQAIRRAVHSETRVAKLLGISSSIVWLADGEGNALARNPKWEEATGMKWPDYAGRGWLKAVHRDDRAKLQPVGRLDGRDFHEAEFRLSAGTPDDWRWYTSRSVVVPGQSGYGEEWITALRDIHDRKMAQERRELLIGELRHRMQNLITVIDALAQNSKAGDDPAVEAYLARFLGRLHAMGGAADLLLAEGRSSIEFGALVRLTLEPFSEDLSQRFSIAGPEVRLSEEAGGNMGMAIHELATNAVKYGALSSPEGRVSIDWSLTPDGEGEMFTFTWTETCGPTPVAPARRGFGTRVIRAAAMRERRGDVAVEYPAEGLRCRISFLCEARDPAAERALMS